MAIGLSGIASGIDTATIVSQLMSIERQASTRLTLRQNAIQGRDTSLREVSAKLQTLKTAATALKEPTLWGDIQDTVSSDITKITASRVGAIVPGVYSVEVQSLAVTEQWTHTFTPQAGAGQITLSQAGQPDVVVGYAANATAVDAAAAINRSSTAYATAAVIDGKLVLSSKVGGAAGSFTAAGAELSGAVEKAGVDAAYTVNGVAKTSSTNAATGGVPGMSISLKAITTAPVTLTVSEPKRDLPGVKEKVKAFVDAYNGAITTLNAKATEKRVANPTSAFDAARGQLFGDRALGGMLSALRNQVQEVVDGNPEALDQLSEMGISVPRASGATGADARMGKLVFDETKLTAALELDPVGVQRLMGGVPGMDGFAQKIIKTLDGYIDTTTQAGVSVKGTIVSRLEATAREIDGMKDQMTTLDKRLEGKEKRLKAQFAAMEKALGLAQTQQSWLTGQLAGLAR